LPHANGHQNGHEADLFIPRRGGGLAQLLRAYKLDSANSGRVAQLIRAYRKQLRAHPTTIQRQLMKRAAVLTAKAEACAVDPTVSLEDVVRLDNVAARARSEMAAALHRPELGRVDLDAVFNGDAR
jgi:hypothetical protein